MSKVTPRPASHWKIGVSLPEIKHPLSLIESPRFLDVRGVSQGGESRLNLNSSLTGRPLASEGIISPRKSFSAKSYNEEPSCTPFPTSRSLVNEGCNGSPRKSFSALNQEIKGSPRKNENLITQATIASIPEDVEVKHGDPASTRLPLFGSSANLGHKDAKSRTSSRASKTSGKARLEIDELEAALREKLRQNYYDIQKKFKDNDPEGRGNVSRDAFTRVLVTVLGRAIAGSTCQGFLERLGFAERQIIPFVELFAYFRNSAESTHRHWLDPVNRVSQDRVPMTSRQVHANLKEKARQKFLNLADMIPQNNGGGSERITKAEFRQMLNRLNFYMEDTEFEQLWLRYDPANEGIVQGERFLNALGIEWRNDSGIGSPRVAPIQDGIQRESSRPTPTTMDRPDIFEKRALRKKDLKRRDQANIERWLKNKFRDNFCDMRDTFEAKDPERNGLVTFEDFLDVLGTFGFKLEKNFLGTFLSRCCIKAVGKEVHYREFLRRFQDRNDENAMTSNVLNDDRQRDQAPYRVEPAEKRTPALPVQPDSPRNFEKNLKGTMSPFIQAVISDEELAKSHKSRSNHELFKVIKALLTSRYQEVEQRFHELDQANTRRLTQETMYSLLQSFDVCQDITREEIREMWRTFITNSDRTLDYLQLIRHFGFSMRSAAFPNAKLQPPQRGDADFMKRSRKLNCAADILQDSLRAKVQYLWDDLFQEFTNMDPYNTGCVSQEEFAEVLTELCVNLSNLELHQLILKFALKNDGRVSYIEFLKPFALTKEIWRHGNDMLRLLQFPEPGVPVPDMAHPPQKGLPGVTIKLRQKLSGDWKNLRRAFKKLDVTGKGYLSLPEFRSVLQLASVVLDDNEVYHLMAEFDRDLTGKISYDKFIQRTFQPRAKKPLCQEKGDK